MFLPNMTRIRSSQQHITDSDSHAYQRGETEQGDLAGSETDLLLSSRYLLPTCTAYVRTHRAPVSSNLTSPLQVFFPPVLSSGSFHFHLKDFVELVALLFGEKVSPVVLCSLPDELIAAFLTPVKWENRIRQGRPTTILLSVSMTCHSSSGTYVDRFAFMLLKLHCWTTWSNNWSLSAVSFTFPPRKSASLLICALQYTGYLHVCRNWKWSEQSLKAPWIDEHFFILDCQDVAVIQSFQPALRMFEPELHSTDVQKTIIIC